MTCEHVSMHMGAACFLMCFLQWVVGSHTVVEGDMLKDQINRVTLRQRAIPALAIVCALATERMGPVTARLFEGLRFCLLVNYRCVPWWIL